MTSTPPSPLRNASTTSSPTSSSVAQAPPPKPAAPPVSILPTQAARLYSFSHPALLLVLLGARFRSLVADPVGELLNDLPFLAVLQVGYVMVCLPPAGALDGGSGDKSASTGVKPSRIGKRKQHGKGDSVSVKVVVSFPPQYSLL